MAEPASVRYPYIASEMRTIVIMAGIMLIVLVVLALVLGLILLVSYLVRRYVPAVRALGGEALKVVQRVPLSSKQSLALVQVGRRMVLIGVTPDRISVLSVIDNPEECAHRRVDVSRGAKGADSTFDAVLSDETGKFGREPLEAAIGPADCSKRPSSPTNTSVRTIAGLCWRCRLYEMPARANSCTSVNRPTIRRRGRGLSCGGRSASAGSEREGMHASRTSSITSTAPVRNGWHRCAWVIG